MSGNGGPAAGGGAGERAGSRALRGWALWLGTVGLLGLLLFLYHYLEVLAARQSGSPLRPFITELTGALAVGLGYFPLRRLVRRLPLTAASWPPLRYRLPVYLAAMLACAAGATTLMWGLRSALFPLAGLGPYDYGVMPLRYLMELPMQLIAFTVLVGGLHAVAALEAARARELQAARVEGSLARAQLRSLRLQLQPHFLFNALHTISAAMYEDPAAADEMLEQLAELLRASLRTAQADEVPLAEEVALLDRYLALQRARFGDRLAVAVQVGAGAESLLVPSLILQPLVENAIRHGNAERSGRGSIAVRAREEGGQLVIEVDNDRCGQPDAGGAGSAGGGKSERPAQRHDGGTPTDRTASWDRAGDRAEDRAVGRDRADRAVGRAGPAQRPQGEAGLGLAATAERLQLLYGDRQSFVAGPGAAGGFLVRVSLPARRGGDAAEPAA